MEHCATCPRSAPQSLKPNHEHQDLRDSFKQGLKQPKEKVRLPSRTVVTAKRKDYLCIYTHMYVCLYVHVYRHFYISTYIHKYLDAHLYVCVYIWEFPKIRGHLVETDPSN